MRVRIAYTVDANDDLRAAINHHFGRPGLATRAQVAEWYVANGTSGDDDLMHDLDVQIDAVVAEYGDLTAERVSE